MRKSDLVQIIADKNPHLQFRDVERLINAFFDEISTSMAYGDRVEIRGFGIFGTKKHPPRKGRNPRTGAEVFVDSKAVPFFKIGKTLHEKLNDGNE